MPLKEILMAQISSERPEAFLAQDLVIWAILEAGVEGSLAPGDGSAEVRDLSAHPWGCCHSVFIS